MTIRRIIACFALVIILSLVSSIARAQRIAIDVLEPAGREAVKAFPVAVGIVLPQGTMVAEPGGPSGPGEVGGKLVDDAGNSIPVYAQATGWWNKEKTDPKWILLRFNADTDRKYFFEVAGEPTAVDAGSLITQIDQQITINTGPLQTTLVPNAGLIQSLELNGKPMLAARGLGAVVTINRGKSKRAAAMSDWTLSVIEDSPVRAVIDATADFTDTHGADFPYRAAQVTLRFEFHKNESFVRLYHTFMWLAMNPIAAVVITIVVLIRL